MGKHKAVFSPHLDTGDHVVIVNAGQVKVTGRKLEQKVYYRHSGYPGGLRAETLGTLLKRKPTWVIEHAVRGMLPRTRLGDAMMGKLRVYAGPEHPHEGQVSPGTGAAKRARRQAAPEPQRIEMAGTAAEEAEPQAT
jgi:large subunit ribosomal protein L13